MSSYTVGTKTFDALIFGYYEDDRLMYAARTRNGFTPVVREVRSNGKMSEWLKEHVWKAKRASDTEPLRRGSTHTRSAT